MDANPRWGVALLVLMGACAALFMFRTTALGPGVSPDSTVYLGTAQSLLAGRGFAVAGAPMVRFPPLYPLLLAAAGTLRHGDPLEGARWLGALVYGANTVLFGLAVGLGARRRLSAIVGALGVFLPSTHVLAAHAMAWSEGPFITFALAALLALAAYALRPDRRLLLATALLVAAALCTRYVGVALLAPLVAAPVAFGQGNARRRLGDAWLSAAVAFLPLSLWLLRNLAVGGTATGRSLQVHLFGMSHLRDLAKTVQGFGLSVSMPAWAQGLYAIGVGASLVGALLILGRKGCLRKQALSPQIASACLGLLFVGMYLAFTLASISLWDAATALDARILLPAMLVLAMAGIALASALAQALHRRALWPIFVLLLACGALVNGRSALAEAADIHANGREYTSRFWRESKVISYLKELPDGLVYSNAYDAIGYLTGKRALMFPAKVDHVTLKPNPDYAEQLRRMVEECREQKALIVSVDAVAYRWYLPSAQDLEMAELPVLRAFPDGVIYGQAASGATEPAAAPSSHALIATLKAVEGEPRLIFYQAPAGLWTPVASAGAHRSAIAAGEVRFMFGLDHDGDGVSEIATLKIVDGASVLLIYAQPAGPEEPAVVLASNRQPIPAGDVRFMFGVDRDGDGVEEVAAVKVVGGTSYLYIYTAPTGPGAEAAMVAANAAPIPSGDVRWMCPVDYDGDGVTEIAVVKVLEGVPYLYIYTCPKGMWTGVQQVAANAAPIPSGELHGLFAIDIDDDGPDEIAVVKTVGGTRYLYIYTCPTGPWTGVSRVAANRAPIVSGQLLNILPVKSGARGP